MASKQIKISDCSIMHSIVAIHGPFIIIINVIDCCCCCCWREI